MCIRDSIDVAAPVDCPRLARTLRDIFAIQWSDNVKARVLDDACCNSYHTGLTAVPCRSQLLLYDYYARKALRQGTSPKRRQKTDAAKARDNAPRGAQI